MAQESYETVDWVSDIEEIGGECAALEFKEGIHKQGRRWMNRKWSTVGMLKISSVR